MDLLGHHGVGDGENATITSKTLTFCFENWNFAGNDRSAGRAPMTVILAKDVCMFLDLWVYYEIQLD